jgi:hypothetical protein
MGALSDRKMEIVRTLVESAPDRIVGGLQQALAQSSGDSVLAGVKLLVEAEAVDRLLRNDVFQPVTPLFVGDGANDHSLVFPNRALSLIWRGLKTAAPTDMAAAAGAAAAIAKALAAEQRPPDPTRIFDTLVLTAAAALRESDGRDFRLAAELCERARPGSAEELAACMDISPVVRHTLSRLTDWVATPGDDNAAAARLAYKDAVAIAEDAGPRFFEMLAAQITPPWMVLRIISAIMDNPTERYLSVSELGGFPERELKDIDEALQAIAKLDIDGGLKAGAAAAELVGVITQQTFEMECCIELNKDSGWGKRLHGQKMSLAAVVEGKLKDAEKLAAIALPTQSQSGRFRKQAPKLDMAPDPKLVGRAMTLLSFMAETRGYANHGGFSAAHAKVLEKLTATLDHYVDEVLDIVRNNMADKDLALAFLLVAADFNGLIRDDKAADLVRRRAMSACHGEPGHAAEG